jgi:glucokinase
MTEQGELLLAADVGGTKTKLGVYSASNGPTVALEAAEVPSGGYRDMASIVRAFLSGKPWPLRRACLAVAGPVFEGEAKVTNLPWVIEATKLARELDLEAVYLLNDLEAIAWAIPLLGPGDIHTIRAGEPVLRGPQAVVAPGTGLGESFLTWDGLQYQAHPSEGGHADFAPRDELQVGLLQYLQARHGHVSVERVCSGRGIPNIYDYLRDAGFATESEEVAAEIASNPDRAPAIAAAAFRPGASTLCRKTMEMFAAILAFEAGNLALKVLATGGVYFAGGILPHVMPLLETEGFVSSFQSKGRLEAVLSKIPLYVVVSRAAIIGAAACGLASMSASRQVPS